MKLSFGETALLASNLEESEDLDFRIGDPGVVIEILRSKLYAHPIRTMIGEYIANAKDANIEAGKPAHEIIIKSPNIYDSEPHFSVRDFGPGLSPSRVVNVFVRYGVSTKRSTEHQVGGFGIGAKSAWAYSDTFIVTSFYRGTKTVYLAHLGHAKEGALSKLSVTETDEPNGVEVKIPVSDFKDIKAFQDATKRAVCLWGVQPTLTGFDDYKHPVPIKIGKTYKIYRSKDLEHMKSHMVVNASGVPYDFDHQLKSVLENRKMLMVLEEPNTSTLQISASREAFANTDHASRLLVSATAEIVAEIKTALGAGNKLEALDKLQRCGMLDLSGTTDFEHAGIPLQYTNQHFYLKDVHIQARNGKAKVERKFQFIFENGTVTTPLYQKTSISECFYYTLKWHGETKLLPPAYVRLTLALSKYVKAGLPLVANTDKGVESLKWFVNQNALMAHTNIDMVDVSTTTPAQKEAIKREAKPPYIVTKYYNHYSLKKIEVLVSKLDKSQTLVVRGTEPEKMFWQLRAMCKTYKLPYELIDVPTIKANKALENHRQITFNKMVEELRLLPIAKIIGIRRSTNDDPSEDFRFFRHIEEGVVAKFKQFLPNFAEAVRMAKEVDNFKQHYSILPLFLKIPWEYNLDEFPLLRHIQLRHLEPPILKELIGYLQYKRNENEKKKAEMFSGKIEKAKKHIDEKWKEAGTPTGFEEQVESKSKEKNAL